MRNVNRLLILASLILSCQYLPVKQELLNVCWIGGNAVYSDCEQAEPLKWAQLAMPLHYWIDSSLDEFGDSIDGAAGIWNSETCKLLVAAQSKEAANVLILGGVSFGLVDDINNIAVASVSHYGYTSPVSAIMVFNDWTDIHTFMHWTVHEFGHVLGLAHSDSGIMRSMLPANLDEIQRPLPGDSDINAIKTTYCSE